MKQYILIIIFCFSAILASAQGETYVKLNFLPAISLGETADFSKNISPRGTELEVDRFINETLSVGLSIGWNLFREKVEGESFEYEDLLITGTQFRYTNIVPLNLKVKKYFGDFEHSPFLGLGLGTSYSRQNNDAGIFSFVKDQWQFNISPEVGMQFVTSPDVMLLLKIKYSYSFEANNFPAMSYLGLGIGIGIL